MSLLIYPVASLCFYLAFILVRLLNKIWWTPRRVEKMMAKQGIRGPPYRILHGNTKEMASMKREAIATPLELSQNIVPRVAPHLHSWSKLYGESFLIWLGPQPQLVVSNPELAKEMFNNKDGAYQKREAQGYWKKFLGDGLVTSRGEKWHKMRKLANHAFQAESLKGMIPAMISSTEMMLERWQNRVGNEIDGNEEFKLLTSEVICRTAFGSSYKEGEHIFAMLLKLGLIISNTSFQIRVPGIGKYFKTSNDIESDRLEKEIRDSILRLIRGREERAMSGKTDGYGSDFLGSLLEAHHGDDPAKKITLDDIVDECKTFYIGGQETTRNALCWVVFLLALHSDWQEKAREEVLQSFGKEKPDSHAIARLTTMGMIINESLRMYSPSIGIPRKTTRKVRLGDLTIPPNMEVNAAVYALHYNPKIWGNDAHLFKPERFAQGVAKATNNNAAAFIPFGMGPRICAGNNFATIEMKIVLSMILQRYRFTLSPNYLHAPMHILTVSPQHGMQITLHDL